MADSWANRIVGEGEEAPDQLLANPRNWRIHPKAQQSALAAVLDEVGWVQRVLVNRTTGHVVDGHLRVALAISRHEPTVPVTYLELSADEEALVLASLDPLAGMAVTDAEILAELTAAMSVDNADLAELLGLGGAPLLTDPDEVPPLPDDPTTKLGDLWTLGEHRLLCGDSTESADVQRVLGGEEASAVLADPPYNVGYRGGSSGTKRGRPDAYADRFADYPGWLTAVLGCGFEGSDRQAALLLWHSPSHERALLAAMDATRWVDRTLVIWDKGSIQGGLGQAGKQYRTRYEPMWYCHKKGQTPRWHGPGNEADIWEVPGATRNPLHPTMKPVVLYERTLKNHTPPGAVVLELFGGSGTTIIAAEQTGRRARAVEIDPAYCDVIVARWEAATGQTAALDG